MTAISMSVNRHIVDQLADVRAKIKELETVENALKAKVSKEMGDRDSLGGDEYIAQQTLTTRAGSIDTKALEKAGINVDAYRKPETVVMTLRVVKRVMEDA